MTETRGPNPEEVRQNLTEAIGHLEGGPGIDTPAEKEIAKEMLPYAESNDVGMEEARQMDFIASAELVDQTESAEKIVESKEVALEEAGGNSEETQEEVSVAEGAEDTTKKTEEKGMWEKGSEKASNAALSGVKGVTFTALLLKPIVWPFKNIYLTVEKFFQNDLSLSGKEVKEIWVGKPNEEKKKKDK